MRYLTPFWASVILAACTRPESAPPSSDNQIASVITYAAVFVAGALAREVLWRMYPHTRTRKRLSPIRLVARETVAPPMLVDDLHFRRWRWAMRSFLAAGEQCETMIDARGKPRSPFNVRGMKELTDLSARQQAKFKALLLRGGKMRKPDGTVQVLPVIEVRRNDRVVWLMPPRERRIACNVLSYPDEPPPRFKLMGEDVWFEHEGSRHDKL